MKKIAFLVTVITLSSASLFAAMDGQALTRKCAGCHGIDFSKRALGRSDVVKGWSAYRIESALKDYKTTTESDELVMKAQVQNLSDAQIKAIAKYISSLK